MASFPTKENDVLVLAQEMKSGLTANPIIYPEPPVPTLDLGNMLTALTSAQNSLVAAQAASEAAVQAKLNALEALTEAMKKDIRYAENTANGDNEKLMLIGWGARKPKTPIPAPGQPLMLVAALQDEGIVGLSWQSPVEGGKPAAYKIQRRMRPEGPWEDVAASLETQTTLANQPRKTEWEFRVIAINKAGESMPSNTVLVVL